MASQVMLLDYDSGAVVRTFGASGQGVGQLCKCLGMRFTPDGQHLVVASGHEQGTFRLSQWSVEGDFVREAGRGALQWASDVEMASNGDWITYDGVTGEAVVFSGVDGRELQRWGLECNPSRNAVLARSASGELWVRTNGCVTVFLFG